MELTGKFLQELLECLQYAHKFQCSGVPIEHNLLHDCLFNYFPSQFYRKS